MSNQPMTTPKTRAELDALIERAVGLAVETNHFTTSMGQLQIIYLYKQIVPELTAALTQALARVDELEKLALANMAQQSQDLGLYDYYPDDKLLTTEADQGQGKEG